MTWACPERTSRVTHKDKRRFWAKVSPLPGLGTCWEWSSSRSPGGYGRFWLSRTVRSAHRLSYEQHVGVIPTGMVLDHLCRNPACVNPAHLEAVSQQTNVRRACWKTHCRHGHELTPNNMYVNPRGNRTCRTCCRAQWARHDLKRRRKADIV